jgi:Transglutaminase-like superfamily
MHCASLVVEAQRCNGVYPMNNIQYFLRDHAFFCLTSTFCFFLNLRTDKYLCTNTKAFRLLGPHIYGWLADSEPGERAGASLSPDKTLLAEELVDREILSRTQTDCKEARPTVWALPLRTLVAHEKAPSTSYRLSRAAPFFWATASANHSLRKKPLESVIRLVRQRKESHVRTDLQLDIDVTSELTAAFNALRSIFPRNYLCLFDSLSLINFLSHYDIFPTLVFGVRPEPFGAHCWVQAGDVALNDTVQHLREYTPIMAI